MIRFMKVQLPDGQPGISVANVLMLLNVDSNCTALGTQQTQMPTVGTWATLH